MKVLYIIDSLKGYGAEKSLVEITSHFTTVIPVFVQVYGGDDYLKRQLEKNGIKVYSLNLKGKFQFKDAENQILKIIREEKPKIIHSTLFRSDIISRRIKRKLPHILLVGSLVNNSYSSYRKREMTRIQQVKHWFVKKWDRITSKYVDFFISNSEAIVGPNITALKIKKEKIRVINRGRDVSIFSNKNKYNSALPFNSGKHLVFLNVSRLERRKGQIDLIKAFNDFLVSNPTSILVIAGEGPERKNLEELVTILNISNKVFLLGYRTDVPDLFAAANFFIFPTYYEGLSGTLIEAILSKTPSIVSDIPENRECFQDNEALFFPPGDVPELCQKMKEAVIMKDWYLKTTRAANYAIEKFAIEQISRDYENFYQEILQKRI